ncbi:MAG: CBS domain-containing protein, partial [Planctomycetota bacterium]
HLAFLRALLPERRAWASDDAMLERAGVSPDMRDTSTRVLGMMGEDVVDVGERAKNVRVVDVCAPTSATIEREASLFDAIRVFLAHETLSLLVTEGGRTVGILRLSDLFDELARKIQAG